MGGGGGVGEVMGVNQPVKSGRRYKGGMGVSFVDYHYYMNDGVWLW